MTNPQVTALRKDLDKMIAKRDGVLSIMHECELQVNALTDEIEQIRLLQTRIQLDERAITAEQAARQAASGGCPVGGCEE